MSRTTAFKGMPLELVGPELKVGDKAPDFQAVDKGLQPLSLASTGTNVRVFSVVPSLDTPVCDMQTKKFNDEAAKLPSVGFYTISVDLPFAQNRWCNSSFRHRHAMTRNCPSIGITSTSPRPCRFSTAC